MPCSETNIIRGLQARLSLSDQEHVRIIELIAEKHPECLEPDGSGGLYKAVANLCRKARPTIAECQERINTLLGVN